VTSFNIAAACVTELSGCDYCAEVEIQRTEGEGEMINALSALQYPHWLMVAGAVLVVLGFVGLAFRRNGNAEADREPTEVKANQK